MAIAGESAMGGTFEASSRQAMRGALSPPENSQRTLPSSSGLARNAHASSSEPTLRWAKACIEPRHT